MRTLDAQAAMNDLDQKRLKSFDARTIAENKIFEDWSQKYLFPQFGYGLPEDVLENAFMDAVRAVSQHNNYFMFVEMELIFIDLVDAARKKVYVSA